MTVIELDLADVREPSYPIDQLMRRAGFDDTRMAEVVGLDRTWVNRRRRTGRDLDAFEADRWAVAAGYLPHEVWPEWLDTTLVEVS